MYLLHDCIQILVLQLMHYGLMELIHWCKLQAGAPLDGLLDLLHMILRIKTITTMFTGQ